MTLLLGVCTIHAIRYHLRPCKSDPFKDVSLSVNDSLWQDDSKTLGRSDLQTSYCGFRTSYSDWYPFAIWCLSLQIFFICIFCVPHNLVASEPTKFVSMGIEMPYKGAQLIMPGYVSSRADLSCPYKKVGSAWKALCHRKIYLSYRIRNAKQNQAPLLCSLSRLQLWVAGSLNITVELQHCHITIIW